MQWLLNYCVTWFSEITQLISVDRFSFRGQSLDVHVIVTVLRINSALHFAVMCVSSLIDRYSTRSYLCTRCCNNIAVWSILELYKLSFDHVHRSPVGLFVEMPRGNLHLLAIVDQYNKLVRTVPLKRFLSPEKTNRRWLQWLRELTERSSLKIQMRQAA